MKTIRCLIIEDEFPAIELLQGYIAQVPDWTLENTFTNALDALSYLSFNQVDVIFIDIQLPALSGLDFVQAIRTRPLLIITSAYQEHAVKAFELEVFDYLLKPYSFARFVQTVQRVQNQLETKLQSKSDSDVLELISQRVLRKIQLDEIRFIESQREYVEVHASQVILRSKISLADVEARLPAEQFMRIHRSFLVSRNWITAYTRSKISVEEHVLPIGRKYRNAVLEWLAEVS